MADIEDIAETRAAAGAHPAALAYAELLPEIMAVREDALIPIKIDVIVAMTNVLGALPEIRALRPEIQAAFNRFDFAQFDKLELYARALHHAHVLWRAASVPKADVAQLAARLNDVRDMLLKSAEALAAHGLIDGERLQDVKKTPGYRPLATDIATMVEVIRERWAAVQNKTPLSLADLDHYAEQALDLLAAVGLKEQAPITAGEAALNRQRAFTLFVKAYEEARRAVLYLRPEDGDEMVPSLYAGRGGRRPSDATNTTAPNAEAPSAVASGASNVPLRVNNPTGLPATHPLTS